MASRPWYAFYPKDYEQKTAHLTFVQDCAYRRLLDHYYMSGKPLPANAEHLHRMCRAFADTEQAAIDFILTNFFLKTKRGFVQSRVKDELAKAESLSETRRKAAKSRYAKAPAIAVQKHTQSQSQSHKKKETDSADKSAMFVEFWAEYPKKVARRAAERAYLSALSRAPAAEVLAGLKRYRLTVDGKEPRYIAHAATWLNADRWADESGTSTGNGIALNMAAFNTPEEIEHQRRMREKHGLETH